MAALAEAPGVPVPTMHCYCDDAAVIGTPFYVMDYVPGRVFGDPALPALDPDDRGGVYHALIDSMAALHGVDVEAVGLSDFGRPNGYVERQTGAGAASTRPRPPKPTPTWMPWAPGWPITCPPTTRPPSPTAISASAICCWRRSAPRVAAILDWELATIGHPLADLAYACMPYYLPHGVEGVRGIEGLDLAAAGIPTEAEQLARYRERRGLGSIDDWPVFVAAPCSGRRPFSRASTPGPWPAMPATAMR